MLVEDLGSQKEKEKERKLGKRNKELVKKKINHTALACCIHHACLTTHFPQVTI